MDTKKMQNLNVLTEDEKLVMDFVKTREKKVLADIQALSKMHVEDPAAWSESFTYLSRTYGRDSDETFKWYKYYFREHLIPDAIALPLLVQVYMDGAVDRGFVNTLVKAAACEPEETKAARMTEMKKELAEYMNADGYVTVYRGCFEKPFGTETDASRPIEKAFAFTLDQEVARQYATGWFPEKAVVYTLKASVDDLVWCSIYDEEKTVLMLPKTKGGAWEILDEKVIPASEYGTEDTKKMAKQAYSVSFK